MSSLSGSLHRRLIFPRQGSAMLQRALSADSHESGNSWQLLRKFTQHMHCLRAMSQNTRAAVQLYVSPISTRKRGSSHPVNFPEGDEYHRWWWGSCQSTAINVACLVAPGWGVATWSCIFWSTAFTAGRNLSADDSWYAASLADGNLSWNAFGIGNHLGFTHLAAGCVRYSFGAGLLHHVTGRVRNSLGDAVSFHAAFCVRNSLGHTGINP